MDFKEAFMEKEASTVRTYEKKWEEAIIKNKILVKAITR